MATNADIVSAIEEAWDGGRLDELDQYFAPGFRQCAVRDAASTRRPEGSKMATRV